MATQSKKDLLRRHVKDIALKKDMTVRELMDGMENVGGFSAQHMVDGIKILDSMLKDKHSFNFLSFPADIVATGLRGALAASVKYFDAIITTCGTLDHDLARAYGGKYSLGSFYADDAKLHREKIYRLGNVFIDQDEYGLEVEDYFTEIMNDIYRSTDYKKEYSPSELLREFGKRMKDDGSIIRQAYLHNVPIFNPGILDGAFGTQLTMFSQDARLQAQPHKGRGCAEQHRLRQQDHGRAHGRRGDKQAPRHMVEPVQGGTGLRRLHHHGDAVRRQPLGGEAHRGGLVGQGEGEGQAGHDRRRRDDNPADNVLVP